MTRFAARIEVTHRPGILDPQGATIERALPALGWSNVTEVEVGKSIHLVIEASDEEAARAQVDEMCRRLLTNPVLEDYRLELDALTAEPAA
ncbi:MAG: phosphoribosylformylglycinamidine synthase subunit PurS [Actinobacteria bacterium]|nr:phosphoribosylformylglycinamidine synthase subunit PurS [Actinomycetota bacterium]